MKRLLFSFVISLLLCVLTIFGQCDTQITKTHQNFIRSYDSESVHDFSSLDSIGIVFHVLSDHSEVTPEIIQHQFELLENSVSPLISLHYKIVYDDLHDVWSNWNGTKYVEKCISYNLTNGVNVFIAPQPGSCGFAYYPDGRVRIIYVNEKCFIEADNTTLIHEFGHYFNLYHTHSSVNGVDELVNRSNCGLGAGDELCDTPADPRINRLVSTDCKYTGDLVDSNGDRYNPDVTNYMSYSRSSCRNTFTSGQFERMKRTLEGVYSFIVNSPLIPPTNMMVDFVIDTSRTDIQLENRRVRLVTGVKNIGGLASSSSSRLGYYASKDSILNLSGNDPDLLISYDNLDEKIRQGQTDSENQSFTFPDNYSYLILYADYRDKIEESDELNNTLSFNLFPSNTSCIPCETLMFLCK